MSPSIVDHPLLAFKITELAHQMVGETILPADYFHFSVEWDPLRQRWYFVLVIAAQENKCARFIWRHPLSVFSSLEEILDEVSEKFGILLDQILKMNPLADLTESLEVPQGFLP